MIGGAAARAASALGVLAIALLTGGCLRAQVAAAVHSDDTVSGELIIASAVADPNEPGAVLRSPAGLDTRVRTEPYRQDGYAGTRLLFDSLTFDEFGRLNQVPGGDGNRLQFQLRRAGELVLFSGRIDLVQLPAPERVDVQVRMSFPGRITTTNGQLTENEVYWKPAAGQVTDLNATARYADPNATPWTQWFLLVGGMAAVVVLAVSVLAYVAHRRAIRAEPLPVDG